MKLKLSAVQCRVGTEKAFESAVRLISRSDSDLYLLPEYFSYPVGDMSVSTSGKTLKWLESVSRELSTAVAGNVIVKRDDGLYNTLHVYHEGELVATQDKLHPTRSERELGIRCGRKLETFEIYGVRFAGLICADILYPELCRVAGLKGAEVVLNPVVSFRRSELPAQEFRYCLYFTRSFDNAYAIVKAGGAGFTFLGDECVGRSLISTPEGIPARYADENAEELITAEVDVRRIREYREVNYSMRDRNVRAIEDILDGGIEC
ncbi:carbon-nitrogen hydrolase family protein [Geoglobus sp.]